MRDLIESALKGLNADYVEIRVEERESTSITFRGRELDEIGLSTGKGGNVRACVKGGWGFASFNSLDDLRAKALQAVEQARMVGNEKTDLADAPPVVAIIPPHIVSDPAEVSLSEKHRILEEYLDLLWGGPEIQTSSLRYADGHRTMYYGNTQGTFTEQARIDVNFWASAVARAGGDVQQASISMGSLGDFGLVHRMHNTVAELPQKAVDFLNAPQVKGGEYTVILDPILAGVFVHEAFGHLSEADHVYENPKLREVMVLGRRFGGEHLNIVDGAKIPALRGSFQYDEEGVEAHRTDLIREGVLVGTAALAGDRGQDGRDALRQRAGHRAPVPAHRPDDQHHHRAGRGQAGGPAGGRQGRRLLQQLVRRNDQHGAVHLFRRRVVHDPRRPY